MMRGTKESLRDEEKMMRNEARLGAGLALEE